MWKDLAKKNHHNFFGFFNLGVAFLSALIVYIPMGLYIAKYNSINDENYNVLVAGGYDKSGSLSSALILMFICASAVAIFCYFWIKVLEDKALNPKPLVSCLRAVKWSSLLNLLWIILLLVSFFVAWLVPVIPNNANFDNYRNYAYIRIILFSTLGTVFTIVNILTTLYGVLYVDYKVEKDLKVVVEEQSLGTNKI